MPTPNRASFWLLVIAAFLTSSLAPTPASAAGWYVPFAERVRPGHGIRFQQMSFEYRGEEFVDTDWGRVLIDATQYHSRFINILVCRADRRHRRLNVDGCRWAVRNLALPRPLHGLRRLGKHARWHSILNHVQQPHGVFIDLFPNSELRERMDRVEETESTVDELQAIVILCARPVPTVNQLLWTLLFWGGGFRLDTFPVEGDTSNSQGDGGDAVVDSTPPTPGATAAPIPAAVLAAGNYLETFGPPPVPVPPAPDPPPGGFAAPLQRFRVQNSNQHSAFNQCVEIAHAVNLEYLNLTTPRWDTVFPHERGYATDPDLADDTPSAIIYEAREWFFTECSGPDSTACPMVAVLDAFARRENVSGPNTGDPTSRCQEIRALFGFLRNLEVQGLIDRAVDFVRIRHQGAAADYGWNATCEDTDVMPEDLVSTSQGANIDFDWLVEQFDNPHRGVVCSFGRYDVMDPATRKRTSGHMQALYGLRRLDDQMWIYMEDDDDQGSTVVNGSTGLMSWTWEIADLNNDGRYNLSGTNNELELCISVEAIPQPFDDPF